MRECAGDAGSLLALFEGAVHVVLVDAARGGVPGSVERIPVRPARGVGARS